MALTRGVKGLYPCPQCLIRNERQGDVLHKAHLQTTTEMKAILLEAQGKKYVKEQKAILKAVGLRNVDVSPHYLYYCVILSLMKISLTRTYSGGYKTRNRIPPYLSIDSTLSLAAYFKIIYGFKWSNSLTRHLIGTNSPKSTICLYMYTLLHHFMVYYIWLLIGQTVYLAGEV